MGAGGGGGGGVGGKDMGEHASIARVEAPLQRPAPRGNPAPRVHPPRSSPAFIPRTPVPVDVRLRSLR